MVTALEPTAQLTGFHATVCLDGSARSAEALHPALSLAGASGGSVSVAVLAGQEADTQDRVAEQLVAVGLGDTQPAILHTKAAMVEHLSGPANAGRTPVVCTFGRWGTRGRLFGVLGELIRAGSTQVLAVGPNAALNDRSTNRPIIVSSDNVHRIDPLIDAAATLLNPETSQLLIAHVVPEARPNLPLVTSRDAAKFAAAFATPVVANSITGSDVGDAVALLASEQRAAVIITRSWHRPIPHQPTIASHSLSIVAKAPCPVLIVS